MRMRVLERVECIGAAEDDDGDRGGEDGPRARAEEELEAEGAAHCEDRVFCTRPSGV